MSSTQKIKGKVGNTSIIHHIPCYLLILNPSQIPQMPPIMLKMIEENEK